MRDRSINLALAVGGAIAAASLALLAFDLIPDPIDTAYDDIYRASADPLLQVELIPQANRYINRDGFYGRDYDIAKPNGVFRIVAVGDSVAMYFSAERLNHTSLLEESLPTMAGREVEVLNLGVAGYDMPQQLRSLVAKGLKYDPDFVMVSHCINDSLDLRFLVNEVAGLEVSDGALTTSQIALREAIQADGDRDWDTLFADLIEPSDKWGESLAALEELRRLAEEHGFGVLVVLFPALVGLDDYHFAPVHSALALHIETLGMGVVDLVPDYREAGEEEMRTGIPDSIHPSPEGYRVAADAIARYLAAERPWERSAEHVGGAP